MTPAIFFSRIVILGSIAFFIWFIFGPWQQLVIDVTRHELFKIRHRVFLMAADGKLDFRSTQYRELRDTFNSLIRFSHKITFPSMVAVAIARRWEKPGKIRIAEIISQIADHDLRRSLEREWRKATDFVALGTFLRSPTLFLTAIVLAPLLPLLSVLMILDRHTMRNRYHAVKSTVEHGIELEAYRTIRANAAA